MQAFTANQWLIVLLAFVLGMFLGMAFLASPKWKRRYRDEVKRREALEAERTHWEASNIAARAREGEPPPPAPKA